MKDNVIDISNRKEFMEKICEKDAVKFIQIGTSGKNHCLVLSKAALLAIKSGSTFPVELLVGDTKVKFTIMRENTFQRNFNKFQRLNQAAKDSADATVEANDEVAKIGKDIGKNIIT